MDKIDSVSVKRPSATTFWLIADQLNARTEDQRLLYIRAGFPPGWVRAIREAFSLSPRGLEQLLNVSMSTLERRQRQLQPLDLVSSERLDRVATVAVQAAAALGDHATASRWMMARHPALGELTPLHLCETEIGARQVRRTLRAMTEVSDGYRPPPGPEPFLPATAGQHQWPH